MTTSDVLIGAAAIGAVANWWSRGRGDERGELITKPLVTGLLVVAAALTTAHPDGAKPWFEAALVACLIGDIALLPMIDNFVAGLASFLIGHILFGIGGVVIGPHWSWLPAPLLAAVAVHAVLAPQILRGSGELKPAVAAYLVFITAMAVVLCMTGRPWAIFGALAFMFSDSILGWNKFVRPIRHEAVAVMVTYHAALFGLVLALR